MTQERRERLDPLDGLEDLYIQAILDAPPGELRADLLAAGENPEALVAHVDEVFRMAVAGRGRHNVASLAGTVPVEVPDPFAAHDKVGMKRVARSFGCNLMFLGRLKDRIVRVEDLSAGFLARLADALGTEAVVLSAFLAGSARIPTTARFKSDTKPEILDKQSLAEAVEGSALTGEQKTHIMSL